MKNWIFIFISLLMASSGANQEKPNVISGKSAEKTVDKIINDPVKTAIKSQIDDLISQNKINSKQIDLTKEVVKDYKIQVERVLKESKAKEKALKETISANQKKIDSLNYLLESKDSIIVAKVYESVIPKKDSLCVRWEFLTKRTAQNCKKWEQINN